MNKGPAGRPLRLLVLCTHNSARSQLVEGWLRHYLVGLNLDVEVWSAGTEKTRVKPEATMVMNEVGVNLAGHYSKTLYELPDPWNFDLVITVCDAAAETCPAYPAKTHRLHVSLPDPSGKPLAEWRRVRDASGRLARSLAESLAAGRWSEEDELRVAAGL